jgi:hypothetical protein
MGKSVEIPPRLVRTVYRMGSDRNQSFEELEGWDNDAERWGVDPEDRHVIGLMGEMAFAIYADLEINTEIVRWTDDGIDFEVAIDGVERTLDVKTSQKEPYVLPVEEDSVNSDYYVLAHLDDTTVTFYGTATKEMVLNREPERTWFEHDNHQVSISSLNPMPDSDSIVSES